MEYRYNKVVVAVVVAAVTVVAVVGQPTANQEGTVVNCCAWPWHALAIADVCC